MPDYQFWMCDDGDYVLLVTDTGDELIIHEAWLIPGSELED